ncbi:hypothetical protein XI02_22285 [Bradyrhizobium sp. CCBAU 21365]|uniref:hypothetical protein n=1 Tax=Bradyrhizobium sp. CCBAU 21365 TaxID=1325083 RepID=UPI00188C6C9B|nr:hypothetical protein [Bradyrhizobium sp. CCBAU 21365]QOZ17437.1 hypothetical protein XI02_22285 [Bradyrhizobium sp. CCBAU 21365]
MVSKVAQYFDEIIALVGSGMSIPRILKANPHFPCVHTWKCYVYDSRFPERRKRLEEAQDSGSQLGRCARYADEIIALVAGGKTIGQALASNPKFPCRSKFRIYMLAHPDLEQRLEEAKPNRSRIRPYFDEVKRRIDRGETIGSAVAALPVDMTPIVLSAWVKKDPERLRWYESLRACRADRASAVKIAPLVRNDRREHQFKRTLFSNDLYRKVAAAVPNRLDTFREDVITDVIVAILSGKLDKDDITAKALNKIAKPYFDKARFEGRSLTAPVFRGGEDTILDHYDADDNWGT